MLLHAWASVQVQDLVAELARVRRNKIQAGLRELQSALSAVKLLNLGYMEVNQIRPFFKGSLDRFFRLLPACPHLVPASGAGFLIRLAVHAKVSAYFAFLCHLDLTVVGISGHFEGGCRVAVCRICHSLSCDGGAQLDPERQEAVDAEPTPMQRPLPRQLRRNG